ncbi:hypothetical protein JXI42_04295, partial [bacterium]|nr:hypothetical protein [bacterium]
MVTLGSIGQAVSGVDNRVSLVEKDGTTITPVYSGPVTIYKRDPKNTPNEYSLKQNSPNPFNASTKIEFTLPNSADVDFRVYNMAGEQVLNVQDHRGKGDYV